MFFLICPDSPMRLPNLAGAPVSLEEANRLADSIWNYFFAFLISGMTIGVTSMMMQKMMTTNAIGF